MSATKLNVDAVEFTPSKSNSKAIDSSPPKASPSLNHKYMDKTIEADEHEQDNRNFTTYYDKLFYDDADNLDVETELEFPDDTVFDLHPLFLKSPQFHDASNSIIVSTGNSMYSATQINNHQYIKCDNNAAQDIVINGQDNMATNTFYTPSPTTTYYQSPTYEFQQSPQYSFNETPAAQIILDHDEPKLGTEMKYESAQCQYQEQHELYEILIEYHRTFSDILDELKTLTLNEYNASHETVSQIRTSYIQTKCKYISSADKKYIDLTTSQMAFIESQKATHVQSDHSKDVEGLEKGLYEMKQIKVLIDESVCKDIEDIIPWIDQSSPVRRQYVNGKMQSDRYFFSAHINTANNMTNDKNKNKKKNKNSKRNDIHKEN